MVADLKEFGHKLEFAKDSESSDMKNNKLLTMKAETTWKFKIHEDFSNYTANPDSYLEHVKKSVAAVHGILPEDVFVRCVTPGSVAIEVVIREFNTDNETLNRMSTNLATDLATQIGRPVTA